MATRQYNQTRLAEVRTRELVVDCLTFQECGNTITVLQDNIQIAHIQPEHYGALRNYLSRALNDYRKRERDNDNKSTS